MLDRFLWLLFVAAGSQSSVTQPTLPPLTPFETVVKAAYQHEFGETIERPAIYDDPTNGGCASTERHITTTAYLRRSANRSTLLVMYLSPDGTKILRRTRAEVLTPAGTIRVLTVLIRYPETFGDRGLELWQAGQKQINEDHATFAKSRGYRAPLLVFENTNVVVEAAEIRDPHNPEMIRAAAERHGISTGPYEIVMGIDINPLEGRGGLSVLRERSVYVGNYSFWKAPLADREWRMVANTAYHHEIAHHWGWDHDWSVKCGRTKVGYEPFLAAPILFGWEDVDGDGVPEILEDKPYGRRQ
jgi:hypothetical protein